MNNRESYIVEEAGLRQKRRRKGAVKKLVGLPVKKQQGGRVSCQQFCERYGLQPVNEPVVTDTIKKYVEKNDLQGKDWAELCPPFDLLLKYLGNDTPILPRLIFSICDKSLKEESYRVKGGIRKIIKGTQLRKKTVRDDNRKRNEYLDSLKTVIAYLWERAPYLRPYPGDEENPLSGSRQRELLSQLSSLQRAERQIEALRREDKGRKARYAYDHIKQRYLRVGTAITDPSTVLLVYVWKAKEAKNGSHLSEEDYQAIASVMEFWKFFPTDVEHDTIQQILLLKDRIKHYKKAMVEFVSSGWNVEYHPMAYID
jgi:hypothetical protein